MVRCQPQSLPAKFAGAKFFSDDPPFYMSDRVNYIPNTFAASNDGRFGGISRFDSENEDLRGVIDDLTVENRRLRQLIRTGNRQRRSTPSTSTQEQDKLFEVRMHGLPSEKRRELEFLLKNFATSVHSSVPSLTTATSNASSGMNSGNAKPGAPQTDSGYACAPLKAMFLWCHLFLRHQDRLCYQEA